MFIEIINVKKEKNKHFIGNIYRVKGTTISKDGYKSYKLEGTSEIFSQQDCKVLHNVIPLKKGA